jgi:chromosome segregation ATPase
MSENTTGSFRLGTLDDTREVHPVEDNEIVNLQVKKLNRRFRWLLIITVIVVGGLFTVGYLDLKNRFSVQKNSGAREIQNISAIFEDRLNELQKRSDDLESSLTKEMSDLDQKTVVWQKDLTALRNKVDKLDLSGAVKKEREVVLQEIRKEIEPLDQQIKSIQSDLAGVEQKIRAQITPLSASLERNAKDVERLKTLIGPAPGEIVNRDQMELELLKIKKAYRQNLTAEITGLEKQIRLLVERLERLEVKLSSGVSTPATSGKPKSGSTTNTGNAGIQEQNIN